MNNVMVPTTYMIVHKTVRLALQEIKLCVGMCHIEYSECLTPHILLDL